MSIIQLLVVLSAQLAEAVEDVGCVVVRLGEGAGRVEEPLQSLVEPVVGLRVGVSEVDDLLHRLLGLAAKGAAERRDRVVNRGGEC
jgi:hypothetical protein